MNDLYLMHHGVKGMKWGVRRYQNYDGTLKTAGKMVNAPDTYTAMGIVKKQRESGNTAGVSKKILSSIDKNAKDQALFKKPIKSKNDKKLEKNLKRYDKNVRKRGEEFAKKILDKNMKGYQYSINNYVDPRTGNFTNERNLVVYGEEFCRGYFYKSGTMSSYKGRTVSRISNHNKAFEKYSY